MAANLGVRVPFLNREMIEFSARMPVDLKLREDSNGSTYSSGRSRKCYTSRCGLAEEGRLRSADSILAARPAVTIC